jgi:lipase maturation factor 1
MTDASRTRWRPWRFGSGPAVARVFVRALAAISLIAWLSLGAQARVLIGSHGLLPVGDFLDGVRGAGGISLLDLPTVFWRAHSDTALMLGVWAGALASVAALLGVAPRIAFAISTALYLSFASVARDFLSFQWDNLLLECGFLAVFLPRNRPAPVVHFLFRVVLFKLYFESGIAKWQSPIKDWQDGSAMTFYFETAPLPTWLAFYAHHLPAWWHHFESRATLVLELVVPFAVFGPRRARLGAAAVFTLFQIANAATANYGFFCYLAAALHVFLLDDADITGAASRIARLVPDAARGLARWWPLPGSRAKLSRQPRTPLPGLLWAGRIGAALLVALSSLDALASFVDGSAVVEVAGPILRLAAPFRVVNTYHLFGSITRERIEPELQTLDAGDPAAREGDPSGWTAHDLWHKPGAVDRRPDFVAPHQPRVDFQLWFYGLSFRRRQPRYVDALIDRICQDPAAVQPLFPAPLPPRPAAVRLVFWQYAFTSPAEHRATGAWWRRARVAMSRAVPCREAAP